MRRYRLGFALLLCLCPVLVHAQAEEAPKEAATTPVPLPTPAPAPLPAPATVEEIPEAPPVGRWSRFDLGIVVSPGLTFGLQLRYDLTPWPWLTASPAVALGIPSEDGLPFNGGLMLGFGYRHRLAVDLLVGTTRVDRLSLHGTNVNSHMGFGPTVAVGYEFAPGGLHRFFHLTFGQRQTWWSKTIGDQPRQWAWFLGLGGLL